MAHGVRSAGSCSFCVRRSLTLFCRYLLMSEWHRRVPQYQEEEDWQARRVQHEEHKGARVVPTRLIATHAQVGGEHVVTAILFTHEYLEEPR